MTVAHVWPGITPLNVWDLPYDMWCIFAQAADQWISDREAAGRG